MTHIREIDISKWKDHVFSNETLDTASVKQLRIIARKKFSRGSGRAIVMADKATLIFNIGAVQIDPRFRFISLESASAPTAPVAEPVAEPVAYPVMEPEAPEPPLRTEPVEPPKAIVVPEPVASVGTVLGFNPEPVAEPVAVEPEPKTVEPKPKQEKEQIMKAENPGSLEAVLAGAIANHVDIQGMIEKALDEGKLVELIKKHAKPPKVTVVEVRRPGSVTVPVGKSHRLLPSLIKDCSEGAYCFLCGPAGGGKTTAAKQVAEALGIPFYPVSVCKQTSVSNLMGYMNANGQYVESDVYRAFTRGGVLLVDEVDGGNSNVTMSLNAILANGVANFPNGVFEKHPNFVALAGANTWGFGASQEYVGRNPLDQAFLDRFTANYFWDYDEDLEREIAGNDDWTTYVQACREAAFELGIHVVISPRASISGAKQLIYKKRADVEAHVLWNRVGKENAAKIAAKAAEILVKKGGN